jgi:hypothetical protein
MNVRAINHAVGAAGAARAVGAVGAMGAARCSLRVVDYAAD